MYIYIYRYYKGHVMHWKGKVGWFWVATISAFPDLQLRLRAWHSQGTACTRDLYRVAQYHQRSEPYTAGAQWAQGTWHCPFGGFLSHGDIMGDTPKSSTDGFQWNHPAIKGYPHDELDPPPFWTIFPANFGFRMIQSYVNLRQLGRDGRKAPTGNPGTLIKKCWIFDYG